MKVIVVIAAIIALSTGHIILIIPGDNRHYIEGVTRFIWMPDGDGTPILVDLKEPIDEAHLNSENGTNIVYLLYTRRNPHRAQVIVNGNANSIKSSNYIGSRPIKVIVHGWKSNVNSAMNPLITSAFLAVQDCNVFVVDWSAIANSNYNTAAAGVPSIGQFLSNFIVWLINTAGGNWNQVHLVGFGLGAHVVGSAGCQAGGRPSRVTGLDPAGPGWRNNDNALDRNAGQHVEGIHTDGNVLGIFNPVGHADFYPNGGRHPQPGCWLGTCSHLRAIDIFASTVSLNHLNGRLCDNISEAGLSSCNGGTTLRMGNEQERKWALWTSHWQLLACRKK